jgi:iron complex transport system permease protein
MAVDEEKLAKAREIFGSKVTFVVKIAIVTGLFAVLLVSFALGRYAIYPVELVQGIWRHFTDPAVIATSDALSNIDTVIFNLRLPRVLIVMLAGAALSMAGASYQGMFKNPLVSPDLLGASAGAALGACLAMLLNLPNLMIQLFAFGGGILAVALVVTISKWVRVDAILGLVLSGILVGSLFGSGTSIIKLLADADDKLPAITFWLMGSFASVDNRDLYLCLIPIVIGFVMLISQSWKLNVLSFGDEEARSMGVNTRRTRLIVIFASTLLAASTVAIAGVIGWIGLVIPHFARAIVGPNYKVLLPTCMAVGAAFLLIVDDLARLMGPVEIPIGLLTSIIGLPFFFVILRRNKSGW